MSAISSLVAFIAVIVIIVIVWYFVYGLPGHPSLTTSTVMPGGVNSTTNSTSTTTISYAYPCNNFNIFTQGVNSTGIYGCSSSGGPIGLWVGSGNALYEQLNLTGANNVTYVSQISTYGCTTFYENLTPPAQDYKITFKTGPYNANYSVNCTRPSFVLNTTLSPPAKAVYPDIYNANFTNGAYTGWNVSGKGFGTAPLNITAANENPTSPCYVGQPWTNYIGSYVATTFTCGTSISPGNITSSTFYATKPFLNFRLITPQSSLIYIEILYNNSPAIIAHFNTYNISFGANASSTFRNATIPLFPVRGKPIQIRVVADTLNQYGYIAIGDFAQSNQPKQDPGLSQSYNFTP